MEKLCERFGRRADDPAEDADGLILRVACRGEYLLELRRRVVGRDEGRQFSPIAFVDQAEESGCSGRGEVGAAKVIEVECCCLGD